VQPAHLAPSAAALNSTIHIEVKDYFETTAARKLLATIVRSNISSRQWAGGAQQQQ
jgi:hypothetical protein